MRFLRRLAFWTLCVIAMILPPWNIIWWCIGAILHMRGKLDNGTGGLGDGAIPPMFALTFAPVILPLFIIAFPLQNRWERRRYERTKNRLVAAAHWIAEQLRQAGITVTAADFTPLARACYVRADLLPGQEHAYRDMYARALKRFPTFTPRELCCGALPLEPLNREWALSVGITEYAALDWKSPCSICSRKLPAWVQWGNDEDHAELMFADTINEVFYNDGEHLRVEGYLCGECKDRKRWHSAHTHQNPDFKKGA